MNKKLLIGVGALAVLGVGGYLWWKKSQSNGSSSSGSEGGESRSAEASSAETSTEDTAGAGNDKPAPADVADSPKTKKEARKERRQTRRDCKQEAKSKNLKWGSKNRREFMRECKAAGGTNADFAGEQADFAFNGNTF